MDQSALKCNIVVLKVASRCNLNCSYCYMYNLGDTTYLNQPKVMSDEVVDALLERIYNHCQQHGLPYFHFVFHGGEPLLAGKNFFKKFVEKANARLMPTVRPYYGIQTNGMLLTAEWCDLFGELKIQVGISLDGPQAINDQYRLDHKGRGSYQRIIRGLRVAQTSAGLKKKPGILSVINIESDPVDVYEHCKQLQVSSVDFLLPDSNYDQPPLRPDTAVAPETVYADWLIDVFELWFNDDSRVRPKIRLFQQIIQTILGDEIMADNLGTLNNEVLVIETDGGIEAVDSLKMCGNGFTKGMANVRSCEFDEALQTPLAKLYQLSHKKLCSQCEKCPIREVCGGGFIAHRYGKDCGGFNNPSIYCQDLAKLITHIQNRVVEALPARVVRQINLQPYTYREMKRYFQRSRRAGLTAVQAVL